MKKNIIIISASIILICLILFIILASVKKNIPANTTTKATSGTTVTQSGVAPVDNNTTTITNKTPTTATIKPQTTTPTQYSNGVNVPSQVLFFEQEKMTTISDTNAINDIQKLLLNWCNQEMKHVTLNENLILKQKRLYKTVEIVYLKPQIVRLSIDKKVYEINYTKILITTDGSYKNHLFFYTNDTYKVGGYVVAALFNSDNSLYDIIKEN